MREKKKLIILAMLTFVAVAVVILTVVMIKRYQYNQYVEKENSDWVDSKTAKIEEMKNDFDNAATHDGKINVYNNFSLLEKEINDAEEIIAVSSIDEVKEQYNRDMELMKAFLINEYDNLMKENTIENLELVNDVDIINNAKNSLENLLNTVRSDGVCDGDTLCTYENEIAVIIAGYGDRLEAIQKAEAEEAARKEAEEAARKAEEERLAQEEADRKAREAANRSNSSSSGSSGANSNSNSSGSSSSGNSSSSGSSSSGGNSSSGDTNIVREGSLQGDDGNYHSFKIDSDGNVYTESGESFNIGDWADGVH